MVHTSGHPEGRSKKKPFRKFLVDEEQGVAFTTYKGELAHTPIVKDGQGHWSIGIDEEEHFGPVEEVPKHHKHRIKHARKLLKVKGKDTTSYYDE